MTSAGTSHTTRPTGPDGDALLRDAGVNIARDELANFAALADPEAIAGMQSVRLCRRKSHKRICLRVRY